MKEVHAQATSADSATLSYNLHYVGDCDGIPVPPEAKVIDTFARREGKWIVKTNYMPSMPTMASPVSSTPSSSDSQKSFDIMKSLAGTWQGALTTDDPAWSTDKPMSISIRVASHGNALIHELNTGGPEVTVFYVDNNRLTLIHYCDFGNRPQMVAQSMSDGKTVDFELLGFSGSDQIGHVNRGVFTIIDSNHHFEDWTLMPAGGKPVHAHMDLERTK